ncbi:hypothetical protein [Cupriavidus gilardii]|uniref:hypothetical protein n=1 Tax=Cupriavidus gilardii TaxID=82541 RepID=UPI0007E4C8CE|nr:hypothetical protein [Cupriavidus gilardii]
MITTPDPNVTDHDAMQAAPPRPKPHRRRDDALSRHEALQLIRKQVGVIIPPWGVFSSVGSGIALVISVMSFQSSNMQDKVDKNTAPLQAQLIEMDKRLTGRLDAVDKRLDRFGARLDAVEARLGALEVRVGAIDMRLQQVDAKLDRLLSK